MSFYERGWGFEPHVFQGLYILYNYSALPKKSINMKFVHNILSIALAPAVGSLAVVKEVGGSNPSLSKLILYNYSVIK